MQSRILATALCVSLLIPTSAFAQTFSASVHFTSARWSEFEGSDKGFGGRFAWMPSPMIGVEADLTWYPSDFQPENDSIIAEHVYANGTRSPITIASVPFSQKRFEGLFGATFGPRFNGVRPFAKASAGFLNVSPTGGAFACITIFPPPLTCVLAGGQTLPAYEIGAGIEADAGSRVFLRADVTDRILKYPGPTLTPDFEAREDGFFGHAIRVTLGAGLKF